MRGSSPRVIGWLQVQRVAPTVGDVVGGFKSRVTVEYAHGVQTSGWLPFHGRAWQRNYYGHIIRSGDSLNRIAQYITENPQRWSFDRENPFAIAPEPEDACALCPKWRVGRSNKKTGADGGTRTPKPVRALDPEPSVFTNFTTSATTTRCATSAAPVPLYVVLTPQSNS
jgi:hypothetical protein